MTLQGRNEGGREGGVSMESMAEGTSVRQRDTIPGYEATRKKGMLTIIKKKWGKMVRSMHTENPSAEIRERERAFGKQEKGVSRRQRGGEERGGWLTYPALGDAQKILEVLVLETTVPEAQSTEQGPVLARAYVIRIVAARAQAQHVGSCVWRSDGAKGRKAWG